MRERLGTTLAQLTIRDPMRLPLLAATLCLCVLPALEEELPDTRALAEMSENARYQGEADASQVFDRLAGTWTYWGWKGGYFSSEDDARAFFDEHRYMLAMQMAAPNSPQWFNTGMHWPYGTDGPGQGHFYIDFQTGELTSSN